MNINKNTRALVLALALGLLLFSAPEAMAKKEANTAQKGQGQHQSPRQRQGEVPQKPQNPQEITTSQDSKAGQNRLPGNRSDKNNIVHSAKKSQEQRPNSSLAKSQRRDNPAQDKRTFRRGPQSEQGQNRQGRAKDPSPSTITPGQRNAPGQHGSPQISGKPAVTHQKNTKQSPPKTWSSNNLRDQRGKSGLRSDQVTKNKHSKNNTPSSSVIDQQRKDKRTRYAVPAPRQHGKALRPVTHRPDWSRHPGARIHSRPTTKVVKHVVHHLPARHSVILHGGHKYHYHSGRYYRPYGAGFILVRPPVGLFMLHLPIGSRTVISAGLSYHVFGDVYYQAVSGGYRVVAPVREEVNSAWPNQVMVNVELLNVRYAPSDEEEIIAQVDGYTMLDVLGNIPGWLYIEIPGANIQGWVQEEFISTSIGMG